MVFNNINLKIYFNKTGLITVLQANTVTERESSDRTKENQKIEESNEQSRV